jgi:hypothetical protein
MTKIAKPEKRRRSPTSVSDYATVASSAPEKCHGASMSGFRGSCSLDMTSAA